MEKDNSEREDRTPVILPGRTKNDEFEVLVGEDLEDGRDL